MAIIGPARVFGGNLDPQLVSRLFADMETNPDQLPVLQHCLMRMWFQAAKRLGVNPEQAESITLTLEDYATVERLFCNPSNSSKSRSILPVKKTICSERT